MWVHLITAIHCQLYSVVSYFRSATLTCVAFDNLVNVADSAFGWKTPASIQCIVKHSHQIYHFVRSHKKKTF